MKIKKAPGKYYPCCGDTPTFMNGGIGWIAVCFKCKNSVGPFRLTSQAKKAWNDKAEEYFKKVDK